MTEAANVLKKHSKKCMPRPLQGNKHRSTRPSPRCAKAFASSQECSIQCGERDLKADDLKIEPCHMVIVSVGQLLKPAMSQACAFLSPVSGSMSVMAMLRQRGMIHAAHWVFRMRILTILGEPSSNGRSSLCACRPRTNISADAIRELRAQNLSWTAIAKALGIARSTAQAYARQ